MDIFLFPPVVFIITLLFVMFLSELASYLAPVPKTAQGKNRPYACGEETPAEKSAPDYGYFFPFAVFFTLLHAAGLMLATWGLNPLSTGAGFAAVYAAAVALILAVLFAG